MIFKEFEIIDKAKELHLNGEDNEAIKLLSSLDLANSKEANYLLGRIYETAEKGISNIKKDIKIAISFYEKALSLSHPDAGLELADIYYTGYLVKENLKKAEKYWKISSRLGNELATFELANYYYNNNKINDAVQLYSILVNGKFGGNSCFKLAISFLRGNEIKKDVLKAIEYLKKGVELDNVNCLFKLGWLYYKGEVIEQNLNKAIELIKRAGEFELYEEESKAILTAINNSPNLSRK